MLLPAPRTLRSRMLAGFLASACLTTVVGGFGLDRMSALNDDARRTYAQGALTLNEVRAIESAWKDVLIAYGYTQYAVEPIGGREAAATRATELFAGLQVQLTALLEGDAPPAVRAEVERLGAQYQTLADATERAAAAGRVPTPEEQAQQAQASSAALQGISMQTAVTVEAARAAAESLAARAQDSYERARGTVVGLLLLSLVVSVLLAFLTARSVVRPVRRTRDALRLVAAGDLTVRVPTSGSTELAELAEAVNLSLESTAAVIGLVTSSAGRLDAASDGLLVVAGDLTRSTEQAALQAASVTQAAQEVSSSVSTAAAGTAEMSASIREIAQSAQQAASVAEDARQVAARTTRTVTKLGESSAQIGDVVKLITSIAAQTNLLALNATIEAARAGEAGKGFGVVANEVKELAQETAKATEDISQRVEAIQADSDRAVQAIAGIASVIETVSGYQTSIASAVEEQTATTNEMGRNVDDAAQASSSIAEHMAGVAASTSAAQSGVSASHTAAVELRALSRDLQGAVSRFQT